MFFLIFQGLKTFEGNQNDILRLIEKNQINRIPSRPNFSKAFSVSINQEIGKKQALEAEKRRIEEEKRLQQEALAKKQKEEQLEKERQQQLRAAEIEKTAQNLSAITVGSWIEYHQSNEVIKCKLAAKLASSGKYIFTDRAGIKVLEPTINELAQLVVDKQVTLTIENKLFDKALASVINERRKSQREID